MQYLEEDAVDVQKFDAQNENDENFETSIFEKGIDGVIRKGIKRIKRKAFKIYPKPLTDFQQDQHKYLKTDVTTSCTAATSLKSQAAIYNSEKLDLMKIEKTDYAFNKDLQKRMKPGAFKDGE